ncbi:hypothetical protein NE596_16000 [Desulfovibrio desulfuricans]|uniref:alpha/beta fold hydrolase n=1 Tax=Desulfovibrio desulfuricans TaxID=876 RepID=UPI00210C1156|nr:hypothetical protein [Desulfovibrio desulfuricans]MCQ5219658.1 hypothetical protein [Desulfovibrio desulfuricans]MDE8731197.1 hypothetical protein [Desulfovibrio desulfuricans]
MRQEGESRKLISTSRVEEPWFSHPKSKVDLWEGAGHWIMQDRKDDVNAAIITWVDAL